MAQTKIKRPQKKQWGQFMTPIPLSQKILQKFTLTPQTKVLEPSFGRGSFIINLIEQFMEIYPTFQTKEQKLSQILKSNLWGVEIDPLLYQETLNLITARYGFLPPHNLMQQDFFQWDAPLKFDLIVGNPPFGGTLEVAQQVSLEKKYGQRYGLKIKKETYSFFIVKSVEHLTSTGQLAFIAADTFLTIKSMKGLRNFLFQEGANQIEHLTHFSEETDYPMVILKHQRGITSSLTVAQQTLTSDLIKLTPHHSWALPAAYIPYFKGPKLGDYLTASGGLTTGKNEYFLRAIQANRITEKYSFTYVEEPITVVKEEAKARFNKLGVKKREEIIRLENEGAMNLQVKIEEIKPYEVTLPHSAYTYYNKSDGELWYSEPKWAIYWAEAGRALRCFKRNSPWYLQGMGGEKFFNQELITWSLVADRIKARYLPAGFILDNSAPVARVKDEAERYFILGWLNSDLATALQKEVINQTRNIQNKDIERLPYPFWVKEADKQKIIKQVKNWIQLQQKGEIVKGEAAILNAVFGAPLTPTM